MKLIHYARSPLLVVESRQQDPDGAMKPNGLWVSVEGNGDGWRDWCIGEEFGLDKLAVAHEVALASDARILRIGTAEDIDELTRTYSRRLPVAGGRDLVGLLMDWAEMALVYQGIIITPYVWPRRLALHTHWYYGWDCASGCIWDARAVAGIEVCPASAPSSPIHPTDRR